MSLTIIKLASPNYFIADNAIKGVCLHGTAGPLQASIDWLRNPRPDNPDAAVSANYVIGKSGVVYELVDWQAGRRAFANGVVENFDQSIKWLFEAVKSRLNPNLVTVSIEHEASNREMTTRASMTDAQFNSSIELTALILKAARLKANGQTVIGHNQISGTRKYNCPGVIFPPAYTEVLLIRHPDLA
jgi:N-acetyl-anhydromuramyl-L-alanine amidase AmpD